MQKSGAKLPNWARKFRWLWFAVGVLMVLQTPFAVINALRLVPTDHKLAFVVPVGMIIRFAFIWKFFKLWWDTRPASATNINP